MASKSKKMLSEIEKETALVAATSGIYGGRKAALTRNGKRNIQFGRFTITAVHIEFPQDTTETEYADLGRYLLHMDGAIQWFIGDWLAYGDDHTWGETYAKVAKEFGYTMDTLYHYATLARKVKFWIRNPELTPAHHRLVQSKPEVEQVELLALAAENRWTVQQMREAMMSGNQRPQPALLNDVERESLPSLPPDVERLLYRFKRKYEKAADEDRRNILDYMRKLILDFERQIK